VLFLGLALGPELGHEVGAEAALALVEDGSLAPGLVLPRPAGLHLTLLYLGRTAPDAEAELRGRLDGELAGALAPSLDLGTAGAFPSRRKPSVLWLGVTERTPGRLEELRERVVRAASGLDLDLDSELGRPFRPHVTVARVRTARGAPPARVLGAFWEGLPPRVWEPDRVELLESVREAGALPRYEARASWVLAR
jgi:2'-5' RNA ligase